MCSKRTKRWEQPRPCVENQQFLGKTSDDIKLTLLEKSLIQHQNLPGLSKYFLNENKTKLIKAHSTQRKSLADSGPAQFHI